MIAVSRAPIAALQAYKRQMDWTFTWVSSLNSDFNYDFNTSFTEEQQSSGNITYNYRKASSLQQASRSSSDSDSGSGAGSDSGPGEFAAMT
jgi:predicted dithiol-disulfide oxidoreductase (DUF899 family)